MLNKLRNKRIKCMYPDNESFCIDNKVFIIFGEEWELNDKNKGEYYSGRYQLINNKNKEIGHIYYVIKSYMNSALLCDIEIDKSYRKRGLATKLINLFENSCINHNVKYITGELSLVDEYGNNKEDRDNFYLHRGYRILNREIFKSLIDN